jgi:hypothetical protein
MLGGGNGPPIDSMALPIVFTPDGRTVATVPDGWTSHTKGDSIRLWDVRSGKMVRKFDVVKVRSVNEAEPQAWGFSPDGRTFATALTAVTKEGQQSTVTLWETASGKERFNFQPDSHVPVKSLAFSPDSRVVIGGGIDGVIRFWDATTGKELAHTKGYHKGHVVSLAPAADGKTLVSGSTDMTGLVWDVPGLAPSRAQPKELDAAAVERLWKDLAEGTPARAHEAIRTLAAAPKQSMPWLTERIKPIIAPDEEKLRKLVADLDSPQFAVRQKAEDELEKLGELAELALAKLLAGKPNLDTKQRADKLMEKMVTTHPLRPEVLQVVRALAVLEEMGTPEARQLLEKLAGGAAGVAQTREAKLALDRVLKQAAR